jgi:hypothetical protein
MPVGSIQQGEQWIRAGAKIIFGVLLDIILSHAV